MTKTIPYVWALILLLCLIPIAAQAETVSVATAPELLAVLSSDTADTIVLTEDIDLSALTTENTPYVPAGTFHAVLDGQGHTVSGLYATVGLFHTVGSDAVIQNLGLSGTVNGGTVGGVAKVNNGTIRNVCSALNIYATSAGAGIAAENNGTIENCSQVGCVFGQSGMTALGGIAAVNNAQITGCLTDGSVKGSFVDSTKKANYVGGIAGKNTGALEACINRAAIFGNENIGGIVGHNAGSVSLCANYGAVGSDGSAIGGIVGYNAANATVTGCDNRADVRSPKTGVGGVSGRSFGAITQCTNHGSVTANAYMGGIVGTTDGITITGCANYGDVSGTQYVGGIVGEDKASCVFSSANFGSITGTTRGIAGIAGSVISGTVTFDSCLNAAPITAAETAHNFVGGICALSNIDAFSIRNCANTGAINAVNTAGGILGGTKGTIENSYTMVKKVAANLKTPLENCYVYSAATAVQYTDGTMVESLGTDSWVQGEAYPVPKAVDALPSFYTEDVQAGSAIELVYTPDETVAVDLFVTKASLGANAPFDIWAEYSGNNIYLFLPSGTDLSQIAYTTVNARGEAIETQTVDLSDKKKVGVKINNCRLTMSAYQSALPSVYVGITSGTFDEVNTSPDHSYKAYGDMTINVPQVLADEKGWKTVYKSEEKDPLQDGTLQIRGRGNSSWTTDPTQKKSYQVKLEKKQGLLGMESAKKWILLQDSVWLVGQKLGLDLAQDFGFSSTPKGEFVDVFIDGRYIGNMLLTEKVGVSKGGVNISDLDEEYERRQNSTEGLDLTGGYLIEIDNFTGDDLRIITNGNVVSVKSPEKLADTVSDDNEYAYIKDLVTQLFDAVYGEGLMKDGTSYLDHIDIESFARYYWHQEFIGNTDCGSGSTFMYKDKDYIDGAIYAGPIWDNDRCLSYDTTSTENKWVVKNLTRKDAYNTKPTDTFYNALLHRKDFAAYAVWYYENSDIKDIMAGAADYIDRYYAEIRASAEMDHLRWTGTNARNNFNADNVSLLKDRLTSRAAWIDEHYREILTDATVGEPVDVSLPVLTLQNCVGSEEFSYGNVSLRTVDRTGRVLICLYDENGAAVEAGIYVPSVNIPFEFAQKGASVKAFYWESDNTQVPLTLPVDALLTVVP